MLIKRFRRCSELLRLAADFSLRAVQYFDPHRRARDYGGRGCWFRATGRAPDPQLVVCRFANSLLDGYLRLVSVRTR
jgi:hypothetical protein